MDPVQTPTSTPAAKNNDGSADSPAFRLSAQPVVRSGPARQSVEVRDLPRSYGTDILCLMARDRKNLFAYWDIDWNTTFRAQAPSDRRVHLRLLDSEGAEMSLIEVEPMATTCEIAVPNADSAYRGELGYFEPSSVWNRVITSEVVITPPDTMAEEGEPDFATVPFHLAFQRMIDMLRIAKHENESLVTILADLRERVTSPEAAARLTPGEREVAQALESVQLPGTANAPAQSIWSQRKLERILGFRSRARKAVLAMAMAVVLAAPARNTRSAAPLKRRRADSRNYLLSLMPSGISGGGASSRLWLLP